MVRAAPVVVAWLVIACLAATVPAPARALQPTFQKQEITRFPLAQLLPADHSAAMRPDNGRLAYCFVDVDTLGTERLLYFEQLPGGAWSAPQTIETGNDIGYNNALVFDALGTAHLCYRDETNTRMRYRSKSPASAWSAAETIEDHSTTIGQFASIAIGPDGMTPWVSYRRIGSPIAFRVGYRVGASNWSIETVRDGDVTDTSLQIDADGDAYVSHFDRRTGIRRLGLARHDNTSWPIQNTFDSGLHGFPNALALEGGSFPDYQIAYFHADEQWIKLVEGQSGGAFQVELVRPASINTAGGNLQLRLDQGNEPHIVYTQHHGEAAPDSVLYLYRSSGSWTTEVVDAGEVGGASLFLDAMDRPQLVYRKLEGSDWVFYHAFANQAPVCDAGEAVAGEVDTPVSFDGSGSMDPDGTIVSYDWEFGDGTTGSGVTPSHTYTMASTYTVTLTVTDDGALSSSCTTQATIAAGNQVPVCDAGGPYSGHVEEAIAFDGSGSMDPDGTVVSYDWEFGDGLQDTGAAPMHVYTAINTYTVTLTVTDDAAASSSCTSTVVVANQPPVCEPGGSYSGLVDAPITFDGSSSYDADGIIVSYAWEFGDGDSATGTSPTQAHPYAAVGLYTVTLTITDDRDAQSTCSTTAQITIDVQAPICDAGGPYSGTTDDMIAFDGSGSYDPDGSIVSYAWQFGDGATGATHAPAHRYDTPGNYTVTLTVTDGDDLTSTCTAAVNIPNRAPSCDTGGPYEGFAGLPLVLDGSGSSDPDGSSLTFAWQFGDGATGTLATPSHTYAAAGNYTVTLTVMDTQGLAATPCVTQASIVASPITAPELVGNTLCIEAASNVQSIGGFYRQGGASSYTSLTFSPSPGAPVLQSTWCSDQDLTVDARGIEYYLEYQLEGGTASSYGNAATPVRLETDVSLAGVTLTPGAYRMVSAPFQVDGRDDTPALLDDYFGAPGPRSWRLGRWNPAAAGGAGDYDVIPGDTRVAFVPGFAYWLITADGNAWSLDGRSTFPDAGSDAFEIPLVTGWNQVGNPAAYRVTLDRDALRVRRGPDERTFTAAALAGWVQSAIYVHDPTPADPSFPYELAANTLDPWDGCWVYAESAATLLVPGGEATGAPAPGGAAVAARDAPARDAPAVAALAVDAPAVNAPVIAASPFDPAWRLRITATGGAQQASVEIALDAAARDAIDARDLRRPPSVPGCDLLVGARAGGKAGNGAPGEGDGVLLWRDTRRAGGTGARWQIEVSSPGHDVQLSWNAPVIATPSGASGAAPGALLIGVDDAAAHGDAGVARDMTTLGSISLPAGRHTLWIAATPASPGAPQSPDGAASPRATLWATADPNPSAGAVTLRVATPLDGAIELAVYDVMGRRVWRHHLGHARAGEHAIVWNGQGPDGRRLAAGTYFLRATLAGGTRTVTSKFALMR